MATLIIEVSTRGRGQPQYRRVRQFPYTIGRGFDNDLILPDDTVSSSHMQLERDTTGTLYVRNLSHENGTLLDGKKMAFVATPLSLPMTLTLGHTTIRLLSPQQSVTVARPSHHLPGPMQLATRLPFALLLLGAVWSIEAWQVVNAMVSPRSEKDILLAQLPHILSPLLSATLTGFISRLLLHRWQFALQLSIASVTLLMLMVTQEAQSWLSYYYSDHDMGSLFSMVMMASVFTGLFAWQLRAFSSLSHKRAGITAIAIVWPLIAVLSLPAWLREPGFRSQPAMHTLLLPMDERRQPTSDIDTFIQQLQDDLHGDG